MDRTAFSAREEGARLFESAASLVNSRRLTAAEERHALLLLDQIEVENKNLKEELDATTVATRIFTPVPPTKTSPPSEIIATTTTTSRDDALIAATKKQNAA